MSADCLTACSFFLINSPALRVRQGDKKEEEEEQAKVHEHDKLYHVEMDVSDEAWRWSWDRVKQIPGLATFMQV